MSNPPPHPIEEWSRRIREGVLLWGIVVPGLVWAVFMAVLIGLGIKGQVILGVGAVFGLAASFVLVHSIYGIIHRKARSFTEADEKIYEEIRERESAEEQVRLDEIRREDEARERRLNQAAEEKAGRIRAFGFRDRDLSPVLSRLHDSEFRKGENGETLTLPELIARRLFGVDGSETRMLNRVFQSWVRRESENIELFSFGFSSGLEEIGEGYDQETLRQEFHEAIWESAIRTVAGDEHGEIDDQRKSDFEDAVQLEVWLSDWLPRETALFCRKSRLRADGLVHYLIGFREDGSEASGGRPHFNTWEQQPSKLWSLRKAPYHYGGLAGTLTYGPRLEEFHSAVVDLFTDSGDDEAGNPHIDRLYGDSGLQKRLGIGVVRQQSPYPATQVVVGEKKGYVRLCGWWLDGEWQPLAEKDQPEANLSASAPNFLIQPQQSLLNFSDEEENKVLADYLAVAPPSLLRAVSSQGNFEIRRGPVSNGSRVYKFFIKPKAESGTRTEFFRKRPGDLAGAFEEAANYGDLPEPAPEANPMEARGFHRFPFSDCYLKTGTDAAQLCLYIDLGSPAMGDTEQGVRYRERDLWSALRWLGDRLEARDVVVLEREKAQGLIARASLPTDDGLRPYYLKLIEPPLAIQFDSVEIAKGLISEGVLPGGIRCFQVNTRGDDGGMIPVFVTPEYRSLSSVLTETGEGEGEPDREMLSHLVSELALFLKRLTDLGIACTDITLADTFFADENLAGFLDRTTNGESAGGDRLFVADFGSYVRASELSRENRIIKEQYRPPEDRFEGLPVEPEPFQVFLLGILCVEVLVRQPGVIFESVAQLSFGAGKEEFEKTRDEELESLLADSFGAETVKMISRMLAFDPGARPELAELIETGAEPAENQSE